jgi:hypothetical protein
MSTTVLEMDFTYMDYYKQSRYECIQATVCHSFLLLKSPNVETDQYIILQIFDTKIITQRIEVTFVLDICLCHW